MIFAALSLLSLPFWLFCALDNWQTRLQWQRWERQELALSPPIPSGNKETP